MDAVAAGGLEVLTFEGECDVEHTQRLQINDASPEHWRRTWTSDVDTDGTPVSRIALAAFSACDWEEWGPPSGGCDDYPTATVCAEAGDGVVADQFDCVFGSPTVSDGQARVVCGSEFDVGTVLRGSKADRVTVRLWVTSP